MNVIGAIARKSVTVSLINPDGTALTIIGRMNEADLIQLSTHPLIESSTDMKFCQPHWDKLREAIKARGMWHLVAKSGEAAVERMKAELQHGAAASDDTWDPLMNCHWMILGRSLELGGLYLMGRDDAGNDYCPVCEAVKHGQSETNWIEGPAEASLSYAREHNLLGTVSLPPDRPKPID